MGKRHVAVRVCDRCIKDTPANDSVQVCYDHVTYALDLCSAHALMMERDVLGWVRLGRETDTPHAGKKWVPGEQFRSQEKVVPPPPPKVVIDLDAGTETVLSEPEEEPVVEATELRLAYSGRQAMEKCGLTWPQVRDAINTSWAMAPSQDNDAVTIYLSDGLSILVADDGAVIGMRHREAVEHTPQVTTSAKPIVRKGKRGGQGNVGPRDMDAVLAAVKATPGWSVDDSRKHIAVRGPNGESVTLPRTGSDHRGVENSLRDLRAVGLDLRAAARAS